MSNFYLVMALLTSTIERLVLPSAIERQGKEGGHFKFSKVQALL